jgi:hypothetical protein
MQGSEQARQRLRVILEVIAGQRRVQQACEDLGLSVTRLEQLRQTALQAALDSLEPRPGGRPRRQTDERSIVFEPQRHRGTEKRRRELIKEEKRWRGETEWTREIR